MVVESGKKLCLSTQITITKEMQGLLTFKLCGSVKLFEDLLHISCKRVYAFHLWVFFTWKK